ncbi:MAG: glycosyltransferase family 2 protein [Dokdonella sp.]
MNASGETVHPSAAVGRDDMSSAPLVSVVMPVYNSTTHMQRPIESVLAQSQASLELILVDDGSSDGSWSMIERYAAADPRISALRLPRNEGVAAARNAALQHARGEYIAFLDSDDGWHPRKLELQLAHMQASGCDVSYAAYVRVGEDGRQLSQVAPPQTLTHADLLRSNHIGHLTGIYRRGLGEFRFRRIGHEDYAFWLDVLRQAGSAERTLHDEPLAWYLVRAGSVSSHKLRAARWQWRIYREVEQLGRLAASRYMLHYVVNALYKRR